jgi:hypothetical protein
MIRPSLLLISSVSDIQEFTVTVNTNQQTLYETCMYYIWVIFLFLFIYGLYADTFISSD